MKNIAKIILFIGLTVLFKFQVIGQENKEKKDSTEIKYVEDLPVLLVDNKEYQFGEIPQFIKQNQEYPTNQLDCTGKVIISFYVEKDGTISNLQYEQKLCPGFDEKSMEVIKLMNKWRPAMNCGRPIRLKLTFPIIWKLE
jgi:hypothetical protein